MPAAGVWVVVTGQVGDLPIVKRYRTDLSKPDPNMPYQVVISIAFNKADALGLPDDSETEAKDVYGRPRYGQNKESRL